MFPVFARRNNLDVGKIHILHMDAASLALALMEKKVDAICGGLGEVPIILEKGFTINTIQYADWKTNVIGLVLLTHNEIIETKPKLVTAFTDAFWRGWRDAIKDQKAAVAATKKNVPEMNEQVAMKGLNLAINYITSPNSRTLGKASVEDWADTISIIAEVMKLDPKVPASKYYTQDLLPADLPTF